MSSTRILVLSSLFPSDLQPVAGVFIRERMFRLGRTMPVCVVAPVAWFPGQSILRRIRPGFRPQPPRRERMDGIDIYRPRYLSVPGALKWLDGLSMAICAASTLRQVRRGFRFDVIDAHFAYPDGCAGVLLGRWFRVPVTVTLRGTEVPLSRTRMRRVLLQHVLRSADRIIAVAGSLRDLAIRLGADEAATTVVGNGVDLETFRPIARAEARTRLEIPLDAHVLVTVGALVERKGFHRVIELLPGLRARFPKLLYLIVGGASPEGDRRACIEDLVDRLGLAGCVRFLGPLRPEELRYPLSAADAFVLATSNEGWANVLLEAMACGTPVVTTDVGGNREVVAEPTVGTVVPFGDPRRLECALESALRTDWDRDRIVQYARENSWDRRIAQLQALFDELVGAGATIADAVGSGADPTPPGWPAVGRQPSRETENADR